MKIKMEWPEFVAIATVAVSRHFTQLGETREIGPPEFRKRNTYEPDMDMYDYPDYVEFDLK